MGKKNDKSRGKLSANKRNELKVLSDAILVKSREKSTDINSELENYNEIYNLLERIMKIQSDVKVPIKSERSEKCIENFISWCTRQGANLDNIELKNFHDLGIGLVSRRKMKKGDVFIEIPEDMIFSYSKIENSIPEILRQKVFMECPLFEGKSNVKLALSLMIQRLDSASRFKPYFDVLPSKFTTVLYFTPSEMLELKGTSAMSPAMKQVKFIASQYAFLYKYLMISATDNDPIIEDLRDNFTYEFYRWAVSVVMTRQNLLDESVLIPAWDMANHTNGMVNTQYNHESKKIESFCIKDFEVGEQVTISYGNRSNSDFLIHNGFVFEQNSNSDFFIRLQLNKSDKLYESRKILLNRIQLNDSGDFKVYPDQSAELLGFIRVFNMNKEQLDEWTEADNEKVKNLSSLVFDMGKDFELKILQSLLIRVKILLKILPNDLSETLAPLNIGNVSKIKSMLIKYRVLERSTLQSIEKDLSEKIKNASSA